MSQPLPKRVLAFAVLSLFVTSLAPSILTINNDERSRQHRPGWQTVATKTSVWRPVRLTHRNSALIREGRRNSVLQTPQAERTAHRECCPTDAKSALIRCLIIHFSYSAAADRQNAAATLNARIRGRLESVERTLATRYDRNCFLPLYRWSTVMERRWP